MLVVVVFMCVASVFDLSYDTAAPFVLASSSLSVPQSFLEHYTLSNIYNSIVISFYVYFILCFIYTILQLL